MPVQSTSVIAYRDIEPTLGKKQQLIFGVLGLFANMTNNELARYLDWQINTVTPRVFELRKLGLIEEGERRPCDVSGRLSIAWKIK